MSGNNNPGDEQDDYISEVQAAIAHQEVEVKRLEAKLSELAKQLSEAKVALTITATTTFEEWKANGRKF